MLYDHKTRRLLLGLTLVVVVGVAAMILAPFVSAILWAVVLSILSARLHEWFKKGLARLPAGFRDNLAPALTVFSTVLVFALPALLTVLVVTSQMDKWVAQDSLHAAVESFQGKFHSIGSGQLASWVDQNHVELIRAVRVLAVKSGASVGQQGLQLLFAMVTQFFMLRDGARLREPFLRLAPLEIEASEKLLKRVAGTTRAVFVGTVIVAIVQGVGTAAILGFAAVPYAVLLGALAAACAIVPLVGAPFVYVPAAIWLFLDGRPGAAIGVLAGGFLIISQIDNVLKPLLIGNQTGLHPIAVFFAILGGIMLFGPVGLMAGPMVLSVCLVLIEAWGEDGEPRTLPGS